MTTRAIRTTDAATSCDVCGRTLLRGEHAESYLDAGARRSVCELCTTRAVHEGWMQEGTTPPYHPEDTSSECRRTRLSPLLSRLPGRRSRRPVSAPNEPVASEPVPYEPVRPPVREPRHVRAVPISAHRKIARATELFNSSKHRRTVAGVSRSLGPPTVSVRPSGARASVVAVVVSWKLCWYRYEIDLSDEPSVRLADQGYKLDQLSEEQRTPNAVANETGRLEL